MICPSCGSTDVRISHKKSGDPFHRLYRCRSCRSHFKVKAPLTKPLLLVLGLAVLLALAATLALDRPEEQMTDPAVMVAPEMADDLELANKGDADAQYRMGMYHWGREDFHEAFPWFAKAAAKNAEAKYYLGVAYLGGHGTVQNFRSAFEQFEQCARLGNQDAQYQLGLMYRGGIGVEKSRELAYTWLNVAAAQGHVSAKEYRDRLSDLMSTEEVSRAQEASAQELKRLPVAATVAASGAAPQ